MSEKKKYVLIHPYDANHPERVLLVLKDRPAWQAGCLNLVGGKIESGETEIETTIRELKEESGLTVRPTRRQPKDRHADLLLTGAIVSETSMVYCVSLPVDSTKKLKPRKGETEITAWYDWNVVKRDPRLMPNLRIVIPMMQAGVTGWFVSGNPVGDGVYDASVRFLLDHAVPHRPEE